MTEDNTHLSLSTLRLFDAILASMNQFAITSLVLRNFGDAVEGPALGLGASVAADQEMVRAVVERFIDATPTHISSAMPEAVVAAAMRLEGTGGSSEAILEPRGCDDYVGDCLDRLRFNQEYIAKCWVPKSAFIPLEQDNSSGGMYPGVFLTSLIGQFGLVVRRHMAYNLLLTSMVTRLAALADPGVCAFLFLANSTVVPTEHPRLCFLYDALVQASADAYVKSERVPRFAARLARQRREGVETAIRVGAAHPRAQELVSNVDSSSRPQASSGLMDVDPVQQKDVVTKNRAEAVRAAAFLGTPIKRFVHGYIVLDEFGKEMAAMAMALHTLELDRMMDRSGLVDVKEDLAELLEYYDPEEPGYKQMAMVHQMLRAHRMSIIELGQNHPK
ncbi:hypothetical protein BX070DRAFT_230361 [Coemansia spiralis]|nr:hypothetical protein BX070DRAFT_230361 [Coemansia spiralis]